MFRQWSKLLSQLLIIPEGMFDGQDRPALRDGVLEEAMLFKSIFDYDEYIADSIPRGYGLSSYEIHLKQCKAKWEATQQGLPKSERKPLPEEPETDTQLGGKDLLDAQNEAATQVFNTETLEACANCGRTFLQDRLVIHQKSCTSSSPAARVGAARLSSSSCGASPETLMPAATAPGLQVARSSKGAGLQRSSVPEPDSEFDVPRRTDNLAGSYGGIARRSSRGLRSSQTVSTSGLSERSSFEILEERLMRVEQELADTKALVKDLRAIIEKGPS